ncbi:cyclase family protein [Mesorhizobium sp. B4-1-4]|uniref:cyclase family protein n=1 Tax=Mesorhizobium sp. B4-1-4 TaxID=2589888 RepID=UPI0011292E25|nr:cyclase family protein [Mesorhizobium sp. B4-1-4]UCI31829.1 cyclase family protein [Mesorhizobium sp. B4-1-4]
MSERWKNKPEGANWGVFGDDDELGRVNLLTDERRLRAATEIKTGKTFCLSLPLDLPGGTALNPNRKPPERHLALRKGGKPSVNYPLRLENEHYIDTSCDDSITLYTQYSTQWDALSHIGQYFDADGDGVPEVVYYNGFRGGTDILGPDDKDGARARRLGIEKLAETGMQGRGILVDLAKIYGTARKWVGYDDLMRALQDQTVEVEPGDMLCLHTGFAQLLIDMKGTPDPKVLHNACAVLDGRDERLLGWLEVSGIAALIADNFAVEGYPSPVPAGCQHCAALPLHQQCLFKSGIPLGELWYLTELAGWLEKNGRNRFFLTAPPLRLPGSFGSPLTPVATV